MKDAQAASSSVGSCPLKNPTCETIAKQLADLDDAEQKAILNQDIYDRMDADASMPPPKGYRRLGDDPDKMRELLGVDYTNDEIKNMFEPPGTDYRAMLYERESDGALTLAFRGSTGTVGMSEDWRQNYIQTSGFQSSHYERAKELGNLLSAAAEINGRQFDITGHSKGGGMAGAAALWSGSRAVTFNPAGVHQNTVPGVNMTKAPDTITDYVVEGDFLNHKLQDNREYIHAGAAGGAGLLGGKVAGPLGAKVAFDLTEHAVEDTIPTNVGKRVSLPNKTPEDMKWYHLKRQASRAVGVEQHLMPAVHAGIEAAKDQLTETARRLGCP